MTPTTPTIADLGRFIGKPVRYEFALDGDWHERTADLTITTLGRLGISTRNIRPILRPLESLTEEEKYALMMVAFGWEQGYPVKSKSYSTYLELSANGYTLDITIDGKIGAECDEDEIGPAYAVDIYALALYNYLHKIGIDVNGWLQRGWAVEKEVAG
ncbi:hypothetical protein GCM10028807_58140 [Spirosoma daeguense]